MLEDADDLIGDPNDIDEIIEGQAEDVEDEEGGGNDNAQDGGNAEGNADAAKPVKKKVSRPQPKLDPQRLKGPRGITSLEEVFKDFKFHGKGYEKHDLDMVLKHLEHWAHRLFPRFQFLDCLEKIEKLGQKKEVQTYMKKIRMGLETYEEPVRLVDDDDESPANLIGDDAAPTAMDAFDELLNQQLAQARASVAASAPPSVPATPMDKGLNETVPVLTPEQRERMLRNRMLAEERRLARLKANQEREKLASSEDDVLTPAAVSQSVLPVSQSPVVEIMEEGSDGNVFGKLPLSKHLTSMEVSDSCNRSSVVEGTSTLENRSEVIENVNDDSMSQNEGNAVRVAGEGDSRASENTEERVNGDKLGSEYALNMSERQYENADSYFQNTTAIVCSPSEIVNDDPSKKANLPSQHTQDVENGDNYSVSLLEYENRPAPSDTPTASNLSNPPYASTEDVDQLDPRDSTYELQRCDTVEMDAENADNIESTQSRGRPDSLYDLQNCDTVLMMDTEDADSVESSQSLTRAVTAEIVSGNQNSFGALRSIMRIEENIEFPQNEE